MTRQHDAHLLSGAYAVDAVTPEEARLVEHAMTHSEELHGEVVGLVDTAVALGLAVPPTAPPPALRTRLLAAIEDLPQQAAEEPVDGPAAPAGEHVVQRRRPRHRRRLTRPSVLVAAAVAAVLLFSGGFLLQRAVLQPQTDYSQVALAADAEQRQGAVDGGGRVLVSWSPSQRRTAISVTGVHVPAGKTLQLWHVRGTSITSAGLYEPYDVIDGTPLQGDSLAVSIEPAGGSRRPTDPIVQIPLVA